MFIQIGGPITPSGIGNKNYYVVFIDEFTHYHVTYLMSEVFTAFKDFVEKSQAKFNSKIVYLYIVNGREYLSNEMKTYCVRNGTTLYLTVPYTPQLNGVAERLNRSITEKARTILIDAKLSTVFWGEAVLTATYLINLTPSRSLKGHKTPFELWHGKKPTLEYLRIFWLDSLRT